MKIISNYQWHNFLTLEELPTDIRQCELDHLTYNASLNGFIKYRGVLYHITDFMNVSDDQLPGWHGYYTSSAFSATIIKLSDDSEQYQIGTMIL